MIFEHYIPFPCEIRAKNVNRWKQGESKKEGCPISDTLYIFVHFKHGCSI